MAGAVSGFQGEIAGLSLADVIQLKGHNRYSGCITVEYLGNRGAIYFCDGEIIHAEQATFIGEEAIYSILKWPGGTFSLAPEMTTNVCTIHCSLNYLLLEAHRLLDEENNAHGISAGEQQSGPRPVTPSAPQRTVSATAARVMQIGAVNYAVLLDKQGHPVQDDSMEAEALSAKSLFLAQSGNSLGDLLGFGELKSAAVETQHFDLLVYDSKQHYLGIAIASGSKLDAVEAEIRSALVPGGR